MVLASPDAETMSRRFDYDDEVEGFRQEVREWLAANLPPGWGDDDFQLSEPDRETFRLDWNRLLVRDGWICASWPVEYGGRGLSQLETLALTEEFARVGAPMRADWFGDTLVGPTILQWGTEEQKERFIPRIRRGEITWCQGFSEPEAGSDLASLRMTAVLREGQWVINGQKIWTTRADRADYIFLLARTDPTAPKHEGISYLLVPMDQPGVDVRPIAQLDGAADFSEVFFTDALAPEDNVVGGVNNGWIVAMTTLGFERGASATMSHRRFEKELAHIIDAGRSVYAFADPLLRHRLVEQWVRVQLIKYGNRRLLFDTVNGTRQASALASTTKLWWSETHQATMDLAMDLLGEEGQVLSAEAGDDWIPGVGLRPGRPDYPATATQHAFLFSRSDTIGGGTSEIQRNLLAQRVLGLPRGK
jgi:alkylation response protein AidB-like acyl-CoA dehydrogenase